MDADHKNNPDHEIVGHASLSKLEKLCYKHVCCSSGIMHNASACAIPTYNPQKSLEEMSKLSDIETSNEDLDMCNPRNVSGRMHNGQINRYLSEMPPLSCKGVSTKDALAGLIFMSNDKVRRSYFKYGVLGMPIARKPIVDRVKIGTKLFLFEFEARHLWGVFEATSEASLDIEKDAYCASHVPFPAQVRFKVVKKCKPLPESYFQLAIKDNYFTPIKFNFELTMQQVSNLVQLYDMQDEGVGKVGDTTSFATKDNFPFEHVGIDARVEVATNMDHKVPVSAANIGIPSKGRLLNIEEHDNLERALLNLENSQCVKTSDKIIHCVDIQSGIAMRSLFNPTTARLSPESPDKNTSNTQDELFQADNPIGQVAIPELLHYARETAHESQREGMSDNRKISPMGVVDASDAKMKLKRIFECPVDLKVGPLVRLQPCKWKESDRNKSLLQLSLHGYGDPFINESREYNPLHSKANIIAPPSVCVKCHTNDLRRDEFLLEQDNASISHCHLVYSRVSLPAHNSRQSLGINSFPSPTEVVQQDAQPTETMESLDSSIKAYNLLTANPVKDSDNVSKDSEVHLWEALDSVPRIDNSCLMPESANARELRVPDNEAWPKDHAKRFVISSKGSFHPYTSTTTDGDALRHQSHPSAMGHSDMGHPSAMGNGDKNLAENSMCLTRRKEPLESDGIWHARKCEQAVNVDVNHNHISEDDNDTWLERARNAVLNSLKSRSNNIMTSAYRRREQEAHMKIEDQDRRHQLQVLGKRSRLAASSDPPSTSNNDAKPRRSVWSRLSIPRKTCHPMEVVLPDGKFG